MGPERTGVHERRFLPRSADRLRLHGESLCWWCDGWAACLRAAYGAPWWVVCLQCGQVCTRQPEVEA